nr:hypothetical protein BaRGS_017268 [Batillaria attramentaria]KAG5690826.1 hypothetical protein BaRGS_011007 [Batillaria attramentaria]
MNVPALTALGSVFLPHSANVEVDYCFGIILNHCDNPLSLDFYMQVPAKNVNSTTRVFHNTLLPIPGLRYNISSVGSAEGFLYFEMERSTTEDSVTFSVTLKVRLNSRLLGEIWPGSLQRRLISEETVPVPSCASRARNQTSPPPTLGQCIPPHLKKGSKSPAENSSELSVNLDKGCNESKACDDYWLVCNTTSHRCVCGSNFRRQESSRGSFCAPLSHLGESCSGPDDCPSYMHVRCQGGKCVCKDHYKENNTSHVCEPEPAGKAPITPVNAPGTNAPQTTVATHTGGQKGKGGSSKTAVIAGSVVGGVIVLAGILVVAYFAIRRLRRPYHNRELLLENDDSDGIM